MMLNCALFDELSEQARNNPRQRQNYDLRNSSEDMSQRMLNALEPCTVIPIHRHPQSSETVVLLRGSIKQNFYSVKDIGSELVPMLTNSWVLKAGTDAVGCNIPAGQWHNLECLESGTVIFESKDGAWYPLAECDVLS